MDGDVWRKGRACSLMEWKAPRGEAWEVVVPTKRSRSDTVMKLGVQIDIKNERGEWRAWKRVHGSLLVRVKETLVFESSPNNRRLYSFLRK